jgi:DNA-directed RNA polymerase subunit F
MIENIEPVSMAEVVELVQKDKSVEKDAAGFIKKFTKLKSKEAKGLREELKALNLMKLNEKYIVKIIDLLPGNAEELNKIFTDVSLNEDETNKILETVKKFK